MPGSYDDEVVAKFSGTAAREIRKLARETGQTIEQLLTKAASKEAYMVRNSRDNVFRYINKKGENVEVKFK